jgi:hypothetical protein
MYYFQKIKKYIRRKIELIVLDIIQKYDFSAFIKKEVIGFQNIAINLKNLPHLQTAEYVYEKMNTVKDVSSKIELYDFVLDILAVDGPVFEFGVYRGDSINYFADKLSDRIIYGFDSFEGLPEFWRDGFREGASSLNGQMPIVRQNVKLVKGIFSESIETFFLNHEIDKISLVHIDCDLYSSTKIALSHIKDKITSGTIIIFDEYFNYPSWQLHEFKAFQEFIQENNLDYEYLVFNSLHEQVAVRIS